MKPKRAGFLTKVVILILLVTVASALLDMRGKLSAAAEDKAELTEQRNSQLQVNADLRAAVEDGDDPARQDDIARNQLGLVAPGDQLILFTD